MLAKSRESVLRARRHTRAAGYGRRRGNEAPRRGRSVYSRRRGDPIASRAALLLPKDPNDKKNVVIEIRAGTGGEEAALFSADLFRMYVRYAEKEGWRVERLAESVSDTGGFKEVIALVSGQSVYSTLKFESGVHRVQRVPATESQGRIHTSACTVAVLPEAEDIELDIPENDLRIDVYRSSGLVDRASTQPTVQSDNAHTDRSRCDLPGRKSQHKNKAKALKVLDRLLDQMQASADTERSQARRTQVVGDF